MKMMNWNENMKSLEKRKRVLEVAEKIDKAIWEWYSERGLEVPNWKTKKDPEWWSRYLDDLDNKT